MKTLFIWCFWILDSGIWSLVGQELKRSLRNHYVGIISEMTIFPPLEFLNVQEQPNGAGSC